MRQNQEEIDLEEKKFCSRDQEEFDPLVPLVIVPITFIR